MRKLKYVVLSPDQHAVQNHNVYIGSKSFERLEHFNYLGTSLTNQNFFHEEIKCRLQSGNTCYYLAQNLSSSSLLSKNIKVQIYGTIILPFALYGCNTWSSTVSEEHRLKVFSNRVLRKEYGPMRDEVTGHWGRWHNETLYDLYSSNIWVIKSRRMRWAGYVAHIGKRRVAYRILVGRPELKETTWKTRA